MYEAQSIATRSPWARTVFVQPLTRHYQQAYALAKCSVLLRLILTRVDA